MIFQKEIRYFICLFSLSLTLYGCSVYESQDRKDFEALDSYKVKVEDAEFLCRSPDDGLILGNRELCKLVIQE